MIVLINIVPIVMHIILLYVLRNISPGDLSMVELIYNSFVVPVYLILANKTTHVKYDVLRVILLSLVLICNVVIAYIVWGITTSQLGKADSETIQIYNLEFYISEIVLIVGWILKKVIFGKKKR